MTTAISLDYSVGHLLDQPIWLISNLSNGTKIQVYISDMKEFIFLSLFQGGFGKYVYFDTKSLVQFFRNRGDSIDDLNTPVPVSHTILYVYHTHSILLAQYTFDTCRRGDQCRGFLVLFKTSEIIQRNRSPEAQTSTEFKQVVINFNYDEEDYYGIFVYLPTDMLIDIFDIDDQSYRFMCEPITLGSDRETMIMKIASDVVQSYISEHCDRIAVDIFAMNWEIP